MKKQINPIFDNLNPGDYDLKFVKRYMGFYKEIARQMSHYLTSDNIILDLGAGPGNSAELANQIKLACTIYGIEPSNTHNEGVILSTHLKDTNSSVKYVPIRADVNDLDNILEKNNISSLDAVLFMRSLHEIGKSIGGKQLLPALLKNLNKYVSMNGKIIVADPDYARHIVRHKKQYRPIIDATMDFTREQINHADSPEEFVRSGEVHFWMKNAGFFLKEETLFPNLAVFDRLRYEKCFKLRKSPSINYVMTFEKVSHLEI